MSIHFSARDGFPLVGKCFGDPTTAKAGLLIAPAMGVEQHFYADFAHWMAEQGYLVLSFDYRGMGHSRPQAMRRTLRGLQADIKTWAEQDAAGALDELCRRLGGPADARPVHWIGHSLGGQILGLLPNRDKLARVITVGSGNGYWLDNAPSLRRSVWFLWYFLVPLCLPLFGYFPGRRLGMVGDLPQGVMAQWRRWCLSKDYMMVEGGDALRAQYGSLHQPMLSLSFTDDEFMSARSIATLHTFFTGTQAEMWRIDPAELGEPRIGHFGFFRKRFQFSLWHRMQQWLAS